MKIYNALSAFFWIIRQFCLPNPFDVLGDGIPVIIGGYPVFLSPAVLSWIADPIVAVVTRLAVRLYYEPRSSPAVGSTLYMVFYAVHIGLIYLMSLVFSATWLMTLIGFAYIGLHIFVITMINKTQDYYID